MRERACAVIAVKHLTEKYGGTLVASQEKYILIIPNKTEAIRKQNLSMIQTTNETQIITKKRGNIK